MGEIDEVNLVRNLNKADSHKYNYRPRIVVNHH